MNICRIVEYSFEPYTIFHMSNYLVHRKYNVPVTAGFTDGGESWLNLRSPWVNSPLDGNMGVASPVDGVNDGVGALLPVGDIEPN